MRSRLFDSWVLTECYKVALNSPDKSTQSGAILIRLPSQSNKVEVLGKGCNDFPPGVDVTPERLERPDKYDFTGHAERSAIYNAINKGHSVKGAVLYCPWFACGACADAIIRLGISEVVGWSGVEKLVSLTQKDKSQVDWKSSIKNALLMFDDAGIKYRWSDAKIVEDIEVLFSGKKFNLSEF